MKKRELARIVPEVTTIHKFLDLDESIQALIMPLALFVSVKPNPNGKSTTYLVFASVDAHGEPDLAQTVSLELPCRPYCGKGEEGEIAVVTID
jgi:hypothetical protein